MARNEDSALLEEDEGRRGSLATAFQAVGSDVRLRILTELLLGDRDVGDLAKAVGLHPVTVRYHLNILVGDGLVEKRLGRRSGDVGRPPTMYRLRRGEMVTQFPPRRYEMLSEILLGIAGVALSKEELSRLLYEAGREIGANLIKGLEEESGVSVWTPQRFVAGFIKGAMARMGLVSSVVGTGTDFVHYRSFVCPFQELATTHPGEICDSLDKGFHDGLAEGVGLGARYERVACMGHGDKHCEYYVRWAIIPEGE